MISSSQAAIYKTIFLHETLFNIPRERFYQKPKDLSGNLHPFNPDQLFAAFALLVTGCFVSAATFTSEVCKRRRFRVKIKKVIKTHPNADGEKKGRNKGDENMNRIQMSDDSETDIKISK